jgi:hypothetical protein
MVGLGDASEDLNVKILEPSTVQLQTANSPWINGSLFLAAMSLPSTAADLRLRKGKN